jgi:hypothetical protein
MKQDFCDKKTEKETLSKISNAQMHLYRVVVRYSLTFMCQEIPLGQIMYRDKVIKEDYSVSVLD